MPPTDPFVFVQKPKLDLRSCVRRRWGAGVDLDTSLDELRPVAVARDQNDGVFVLSSRLPATGVNREYELHHVSASGVKSGPAVIGPPALLDAVLVSSAPGSCIVVWANASYGGHLQAQRFDDGCNPLWGGPVDLAVQAGGFRALAAVEDGANGAMVAFNLGSLATGGGTDFRVQRIDASGQPLLGQGSIILDATEPNPPIFRPQFLRTGSRFVLLWQAFSGTAPLPATGIWLDSDAEPTSPSFSIVPTFFWFNVARAVADGQDGFWLSALAMGGSPTQLILHRFNPGGLTPAVSVMGKVLAHVQGHSIASDGSGGLLCATLDPAGVLGVDYFNYAGGSIWINSPASHFTTVSMTRVLDGQALAGAAAAQFARDMERFLSIVPRASTGATVVYESLQTTGRTRLKYQCFASDGSKIGPEADVSVGAGEQSNAVLLQPKPPTGIASLVDIFRDDVFFIDRIPPPDPDLVFCAWLTRSATNARTVSAQRLGCCPQQYNIDLVPTRLDYRGAIPFDASLSIPGALTITLPQSNNRVGDFGVLPLSHLAIAGVPLPGSVSSRTVAPPDWITIRIDGVPENVQIQLQSHQGKRIALAKAAEDRSVREFTFKPRAALSYVLVLTRKPANKSAGPMTLRFDALFGRQTAKRESPRKSTASRTRRIRRRKRT